MRRRAASPTGHARVRQRSVRGGRRGQGRSPVGAPSSSPSRSWTTFSRHRPASRLDIALVRGEAAGVRTSAPLYRLRTGLQVQDGRDSLEPAAWADPSAGPRGSRADQPPFTNISGSVPCVMRRASLVAEPTPTASGMVGARGFEPPTPCTPWRPGRHPCCCRRSLQQPEMALSQMLTSRCRVATGRAQSRVISPVSW